MKEYIEREAIKEAITAEKDFYFTDTATTDAYSVGYGNGLTMAYSITLGIPAADVVEKAEIERLRKATHDLENCFNRMDSLYRIKCMELKVARAEAIKEFAEKLKESVEYIPWCDYAPVQRCIDNLVKEMAGDRE